MSIRIEKATRSSCFSERLRVNHKNGGNDLTAKIVGAYDINDEEQVFCQAVGYNDAAEGYKRDIRDVHRWITSELSLFPVSASIYSIPASYIWGMILLSAICLEPIVAI